MSRPGLFALLGVVVALVGCAPSAKRHCEERQRFWERAMGSDDPAYVERSRSLFVESCTKRLEKPEATQELACRQKCLDAAQKSDASGSSSAKEAYATFSDCETRCL